ncbi:MULTISPECIES: hypothetical protein [unclassified Solwaraspora]|uniref:hypothetical protein n=1 Tax=unclassified Solwaraspora TaxID=2627926 RepID=UPI00248AECA1|nr:MULTISPECIES: hypothetical protein [unclassified Solwaraspora]WBB97362.1 hypothetical protein O7553_29750 [Solwaraspora sp. WMMA2059]WBC18736.1 hypothetical protein O7543_17610 [Solwaraspora sp. WMMA2080]WJK33858.1 hypothetical protein O7610_24910 [Solwaraspora sp. WMMA2065]
MRLTVGPLPPAIYWRRRAVVLGALLLLLFIVAYSCIGSDQTGRSQADPTPTPSGEVLTPTTSSPGPEDDSDSVDGDDPDTLGNGDAGDAGGGSTGGGTGDDGTTGGGDQNAPGGPVGPAAGTCTDDEILLTAAASQATAQKGVTLAMQLRVQNVSSRTCDRDVGADPQELYLKRGAELIWSSDTCGAARGTDVRTFGPGSARDYQVAWNGRAASECANNVAAGDHPAAGEYQLFARLGSKVSEPFVITITG